MYFHRRSAALPIARRAAKHLRLRIHRRSLIYASTLKLPYSKDTPLVKYPSGVSHFVISKALSSPRLFSGCLNVASVVHPPQTIALLLGIVYKGVVIVDQIDGRLIASGECQRLVYSCE